MSQAPLGCPVRRRTAGVTKAEACHSLSSQLPSQGCQQTRPGWTQWGLRGRGPVSGFRGLGLLLTGCVTLLQFIASLCLSFHLCNDLTDTMRRRPVKCLARCLANGEGLINCYYLLLSLHRPSSESIILKSRCRRTEETKAL